MARRSPLVPLLLVLALSGPLLLLACDDGPPPGQTDSQQAQPQAAPSPRPQPPQGQDRPGKRPLGPEEESHAELELAEQDFLEGPSNRDPFRSFMSELSRPVKQVTRQQRRVILKRYALDELTLIAVVTGHTRPVAMFRDPTGLGVTVKRGDYISKSSGKVKQILRDKVVIEIEEQAEEKIRQTDRIIELFPKGEVEISPEVQ